MSFSSSSTSYEFRLLVEATNGSTNEGVFTLTKRNTSEADYAGNLSTNPPSFT